MCLLWVLGLVCLASVARADYPCVCNNGEEVEVFDAMSDDANAIGALTKSACKALVLGTTANAGWAAIAYQHHVGYVQTNSMVTAQSCPGTAPDSDKVSTGTGSTSGPVATSTTAGVVTTKMTSPMMTSPTMAVSTTGAVLGSTSTSGTVTSGNTKLCPLALQSFASQDGGILAQYGQSCYEVVPSRHTWGYAESDCKTKGGHLIDITSAAEQDFIFKFMQAHYPHNAWIGLHDINVEGHYEWASGSAVSYTNWLPSRQRTYRSYTDCAYLRLKCSTVSYTNWLPGRQTTYHSYTDCAHMWLKCAAVSYTNWLPGRQTTYHSYTDCAYLRPQNGGYWNEGECGNGPLFTPHAYICQYDIDTTVHGTVEPLGDGDSHQCPSTVQQHATRYYGNLGQYKQSCYELLPRYKVTWSHGEQLCRQEGGHLVQIGDAMEQKFVQEFMTRHMPTHAAWIGLNDRLLENTFQWTSGEAVTYTNWATGHTSNFVSHHLEDCAVFLPYHNGQWDDVTCGSQSVFGDRGEVHPILCEFRSGNVTGSGVQIIG